MFDTYSHFLSYVANDQQTVRDLAGTYDGILVPGTVASFQADGTKGFVLSISATAAAPRYTVDPRFPLFQQSLPSPKRTHQALAAVLGVPELVQPENPLSPAIYSDGLIATITENWMRFNRSFTDLELRKFDKYAARLDERIIPADRKGPTWIIPPYFVAIEDDSRWWSVSERFWHAAADMCQSPESLVRVAAVDQASLLDNTLSKCPEDKLIVWVSNLNERNTDYESIDDLIMYGRAIQDASARGQSIFALYGGFFSVLLAMFGLNGSSHGIGYGEFRAWQELPKSGPPPPRYYLPKAHRYISVDLAIFLWSLEPELVVCTCIECQGSSPEYLDYLSLMKHSVRCRANEIQTWCGMSPDSAISKLSLEAEFIEDTTAALRLPTNMRDTLSQCSESLRAWAGAVGAIAT